MWGGHHLGFIGGVETLRFDGLEVGVRVDLGGKDLGFAYRCIGVLAYRRSGP